MLVVFRGFPGTGKSYLARKLVAARPDLLVLSRDTLRAGVIAHPTFSEEEKSLIDELILSMTGFLLDRGRSVLIDGMALSSAGRVSQFAAEARSRGAGFRLIECVCSEATALARLARDSGAHPAGDRGAKLYREVRARFQPVAEPCLKVDTDDDSERALAAILRYLKA